jgi:2-C-methyl-D-erythritol 2,4-cyclodiphosphate synthase
MHRLTPGRPLILGGVRIPCACGLDGHSDADALAHAVIDALLGAIADGDIGRHFPDTDPQWKDADSLDLLRRTVARLTERGYRVTNTDATVVAEAPRLAPYVASMRERLAQAMGVEIDRVSVKATRAEGLGALGRQEGLAVMAVAAVQRMES